MKLSLLPDRDLSDAEVAAEFAVRRKAAKGALSALAVSLVLAGLAVSFDECVVVSSLCSFLTGSRNAPAPALPAIELSVALFLVLPLSLFALAAAYRCPRCGAGLDLKKNLSPSQCRACGAALLLPRAARDGAAEADDEARRVLTKIFIRRKRAVLVLAALSLVFFWGTLLAFHLGHRSFSAALLFAGIVAASGISCLFRCPKCGASLARRGELPFLSRRVECGACRFRLYESASSGDLINSGAK